MKRRPMIGVIGEQQASVQSMQTAFEVGAEIARRGGVLVCGGLGGIMEAAAKGAKSEGGLTVGILPGDTAEDANPYIDVPIVSDMGEARNILVVRSSQALVAVTGSYGTLSEIAFALKLGIPIIGIDTWYLQKAEPIADPIMRAHSAKEAVSTVWSILGRSEREVS